MSVLLLVSRILRGKWWTNLINGHELFRSVLLIPVQWRKLDLFGVFAHISGILA